MIRSAPARALAALSILGLAACANSDRISADDKPVDQIFAEAEAAAADGDLVVSAQLYDEVERLYPYSQRAKEAMLRAAQAYYGADQYTEARLAAERFLDFYPNDELAPEAQYIVALSWYDQIVDVGRDQGSTQEALAALRETERRYPDTEFARRAALKLDLTEDHLAGKEMEVGRYYLKRGHYVAAVNRFRRVVDDYQTTSHTPEALHRLVEAYLALGVESEAREAAAVLGHNFPGSDWYAHSYAMLTGEDTAPSGQPGGMMSRAWRQVVRGDWL